MTHLPNLTFSPLVCWIILFSEWNTETAHFSVWIPDLALTLSNHPTKTPAELELLLLQWTCYTFGGLIVLGLIIFMILCLCRDDDEELPQEIRMLTARSVSSGNVSSAVQVQNQFGPRAGSVRVFPAKPSVAANDGGMKGMMNEL